MGEEEGLPLIAGGGRPPPSKAWEILWRAAKLLGRAWKLMLPVLFIYLIPSSLLLFGTFITVEPLIIDMARRVSTMKTKDPSSSEFLALLPGLTEDLSGFVAAEVGMLLASLLLSSFLLTGVINVLTMAAKAEKVTFKDLFYKIKTMWKGLLATLLYVNLLAFAYETIWLLLLAFAFFIFGLSLGSSVLTAVITVSGLLLLLYLSMIWSQGVVVSATEEGRYGLTALGRAAELVQGRRELAFQVNCLKFLIFAGWYLIMILLRKVTNPLITLTVSFYPMLLVSVFCLAVDVAFYNECRKAAEGNP
ncbi:unnamed protein product [Spirodela intermedia]|uniref:Uncharacterized protein n=1 Tax=Spirodela intermedia TaxID=51605 RepID=A0A7I8KNL3_SPIIN|nr:unnamed protein product [Spirodela intermedia]